MNFETEMTIVDCFDDPVGNWYLCKNCQTKVFLPTFNREGKPCHLHWCPQCGAEVIKITKLKI